MTTSAGEPLKLFYCYAHEDKTLRDELDAHLAVMKRQKLLEVWYDRQIMPGTKWEQVIDKNLASAHIILLLVSASFLNSDYCYGIEMQKALQRDAEGAARVVPIILRPVDWDGAPFSRLQVLPTGAKPVTRWADRDDAFEDIAKQLRKVVKELSAMLAEEDKPVQQSLQNYVPPAVKQTNPRSTPSAITLFVSHSSKDIEFGLKLVSDLRHELGKDDAVWYDSQGGLSGGDSWWRRIVSELEKRDVFIIIMSPDSMMSSWVMNEIDIALVRGKRIIPVLYRQCNVRTDLARIKQISFLSVPYSFAFDELMRVLRSRTRT